jgi:hypothetical protein
MKGIAKVIGTGQDLLNSLEVVQGAPEAERAGLAAELAARVAAIEERGYICVPVLQVGDDRQTVTIRAGGEIAVGSPIRGADGAAVSEISEIAAPQDAEDGTEPEVWLSVRLTAALPEGAEALCFASPINPLDELGITPETFAAVKEVLKSYE